MVLGGTAKVVWKASGATHEVPKQQQEHGTGHEAKLEPRDLLQGTGRAPPAAGARPSREITRSNTK